MAETLQFSETIRLTNRKRPINCDPFPQWMRVLSYMQNHECITSMIAFDALRITALHPRLRDIEKYTEFKIDRKRIDVPNKPHHYEYRLL